MEDYYYYHCFPQTSWEIHSYVKAGLPGHAASDAPSAPAQLPRAAIHTHMFDDNGTTIGGKLHQHYLEACSLCGRLLGRDKDIFMYRGDTPFCSEECRQRQIDADEAREKKRCKKPVATKREPEWQRQSSNPKWMAVWELPAAH